MILKLRNKRIIIEDNQIPEDVYNTHIVYDYELGTNHYKTVLQIENDVYFGNSPKVNLDYNIDEINFNVKLIDVHGRCVREYSGVYRFKKLCLIGIHELMDVYKQLKQLQEENTKLKEQGEVI